MSFVCSTVPPGGPRMINYRSLKGYKYQTTERYNYECGVMNTVGNSAVNMPFLRFRSNGLLHIKKGYAWDGPSGPTIDTATFMRGSLIHDALYQLMREGHLPEKYRIHADKILRKVCLEDGMSKIRAWWVYWGVRIGAAKYARRIKK